MEHRRQRLWQDLEQLRFVRTSGTAEERRAAEWIASAAAEAGCPAELESFRVPFCVNRHARLAVREPWEAELHCEPSLFSGSTEAGGVTAPLVYVGQAKPEELADVAGKIVLCNDRLKPEVYARLIAADVRGVLLPAGLTTDDPKKWDLFPVILRRKHREAGLLPMASIRVADAVRLIRDRASLIHFELEQEISETDSVNVICEIQGTRLPNEVIVLGAHLDSVKYSAGICDNGSGSVILLEVLRYFLANPPERTLRFIWFGSEEAGLLGSYAYVEAHKEQLEAIRLMINVDIAGAVIGNNRFLVNADPGLVSYVQYLCAERGVVADVSQAVYSSDSVPFAAAGVPAINFTRTPAASSVPLHNRYDDGETLSAEQLEALTDFIACFVERLGGARYFPLPREIPQNVQDDIKDYQKKSGFC